MIEHMAPVKCLISIGSRQPWCSPPTCSGVSVTPYSIHTVRLQVEEGRQWREAMQRALAHWSQRSLYAGFAQWLLYTLVRTTAYVPVTVAY